MSALPSTLNPTQAMPAVEPPPRGVVFIELVDAARRSGQCVGHLRRQCGKVWHAQGKARLHQESGKRSRWLVREDADPAFARAKSVDSHNAAFDMRPFTDVQRKMILTKESVLLAWRSRIDGVPHGDWNAITDAFLQAPQPIDVSRATLYNWHTEYTARGRAGLVDRRWNSPTTTAADASSHADFYAELERWYLDGNRPSKMLAYRGSVRVAHRSGWPSPPSYGHAIRHLRKLDRRKVIRHQEGEKAFDDKVMDYVECDYNTINTNDIWIGDHHVCDVMVIAGRNKDRTPRYVRPWLTAWMDKRSRRIVGYHLSAEAPNATSILLAFRNAVVNCGWVVPARVYIDNGKDFDAYVFQGMTKQQRLKRQARIEPGCFSGIFGDLQIGITHAKAYNAKAKGTLERFFGTFEGQFGKLQHTYCGRSPEQKPHHLDVRLKKGEGPSFEQYAADLSSWIENNYHREHEHTGHGMDGRSPLEVYNTCVVEVRTTTKEALEFCLLKTSTPLKVGRNGVVWKGRKYGKGDPALGGVWGQKVHLRIDPADITRATVWTLDGKPVCEVRAAGLAAIGPFTEDEDRAAEREVGRHKRAVKEATKHGMRMHLDRNEVMIDQRVEKMRLAQGDDPANPPPPPPTLKLVRTGLEDSLDALRKLQEQQRRPALRIAGGGGGGDGAGNIDLLSMASDMDVQPRGTNASGLNLMAFLQKEDD